ncbi:MAG: hypothetical protein ACE5E1_00395 [Phycisphaerae bacterium]
MKGRFSDDRIHLLAPPLRDSPRGRSACRFTLGVAVAAAALMTGCTAPEKAEFQRALDWWKPQPAGVGVQEHWTIECNAYQGPNRQQMADRMATLLKRVSELDADLVWVEHEETRSRVFYGVYMLTYVKADVKRAAPTQENVVIQLSDEIKHDLGFIRQLSLGGQYPFFSARAIAKPESGDLKPEWDLRNAQGFYTLNVGVTYNTPTMHDYRRAALEWVKDLRDRGYDAYYYHDPEQPRISICVGTFGKDAVTIKKWEDDARVLQVKTIYSPEVQALQSKEEFGYNLENGSIVYRTARNPKTGQKARMPNKSFLVKIPRRPELAGH